jgi:hypothetical protein
MNRTDMLNNLLEKNVPYFHPGSASTNLSILNPQNCFYGLGNMIRVVHPGSGSLFSFTHPGSWIQGSKKQRIPDPQHWVSY